MDVIHTSFSFVAVTQTLDLISTYTSSENLFHRMPGRSRLETGASLYLEGHHLPTFLRVNTWAKNKIVILIDSVQSQMNESKIHLHS